MRFSGGMLFWILGIMLLELNKVAGLFRFFRMRFLMFLIGILVFEFWVLLGLLEFCVFGIEGLFEILNKELLFCNWFGLMRFGWILLLFDILLFFLLLGIFLVFLLSLFVIIEGNFLVGLLLLFEDILIGVKLFIFFDEIIFFVFFILFDLDENWFCVN